MLVQSARGIAVVFVCLLLGSWQAALAQQAPPGAAPNAADSEAAQKAKILDSDCWRRAIFELDTWFRTQTIYRPEEVAKMRTDFAERVKTMSAKELQEVIQDMELKFKLLDTPPVIEARAWFAQYVSVLAERRRDDLLREIPNFATMTAAQLQQEILKVQRKKSSQAQFNRKRQTKVDNQMQRNQSNLAAQAAARQSRAQRSAYRSPYRPAPPQRSFDDVRIGPQRSMTIDPGGGLWMNLSF